MPCLVEAGHSWNNNMNLQTSSFDLSAERAQYPNLEALEGGRVQQWLHIRFEDLLRQAGSERLKADSSKTANLIGLGIGIVTWANPLGLPLAVVCGGSYLASVVIDYFDTNKMHPLPFVREGIIEFIEKMGNKELRDRWSEFMEQTGVSQEMYELLQKISYLPEDLEKEARLLTSSMEFIGAKLLSVPPGKRFMAYRYLLLHHRRFGDFSRLGDGLERSMATSKPVDGIDYGAVQAIADFDIPAQPLGSPSFEIAGASPQLGSIPTTAAPVDAHSAAAVQSKPFGSDELDRALSQLEQQKQGAPAAGDRVLQAIKDYVATPKNLFMVATGGSGKGITLANLVRFRAEADPNFQCIWVDPKNLAEETGYFDHPAIKPYRFSAGSCSSEEIGIHMKRALALHRMLCGMLPSKTPVWLILDEWYFVHGSLSANDPDTLSGLEDTIRGTVSLLDAEHKHIVLVSQSPNVGDVLKGGGGLLANLPTLAVFKSDNNGQKLIEKCGQTGAMPKAIAKPEKLQQVCAQSSRNRAIYIGNELLPMPELHNHSGYDRDKQQHINGYAGAAPAVKNYAEQPNPLDAEFDLSVTPTAVATVTPESDEDAFDIAIAKVAKNEDNILDLVDINAVAVTRVITWLDDNRRGRTVTLRDVYSNKRNSQAGVSRVDSAADVMSLLEMLDLCSPTRQDGEYLVIS